MSEEIGLHKKSTKTQIDVFLKPCNEKQELNYLEDFTGTPEQIINRSIQMIDGLHSTFPTGEFSVKIESPNLEQTLYLDSNILFDGDFNEVGDIRDFIQL